MNKRLPSHVFDLPVQELRRGYRSDIYFWREKVVLERQGIRARVAMQVFQKGDAILCGIDEAIAILRVATGRYADYDRAYKLFDRIMDLKLAMRRAYHTDREAYVDLLQQKFEVARQLDEQWQDGFADLEIDALHDGDRITPWETVMHITGEASLFAHLETVYLGALARRTKIATNVRRVVDAAQGKTVLFFPARFDHWAVQGGDGYAAHIGGATAVSTNAQAEWWGVEAAGTIPHALIAAVGGDTVSAVKHYHEVYPQTRLIALVDFDNDSIGTALQCCRALGEKLWGIRLDTSETLVDKAILPSMGRLNPTGVNPELVFLTRQALDREAFGHVKIVASGGFNPEKIAMFERHHVPVDAYGVGSDLMRGSCDFTADVVLRNGLRCAKVGREYLPNPRLERVS
jgi:nicotinate phosphoribosyltransferase